MTSRFGMGPIVAATVTVADLDAAVARYEKTVGYVAAGRGRVGAALAAAWNAPAMAGRAWALVRPESGEPGWIRFVEGTRPASYRPLAHYGWAANEILLRDTEAMHRRMQHSEFTIIGKPHPLKATPAIVAMQAIGPDGEALYLTNRPQGASPHDLPQAKCEIDRIFIMVLGVSDFAAANADLEGRFGAKKTVERTRGVNFVGDGYGLRDEGRPLPMSTVQLDGQCVIQVDGMQASATARPCAPGELPPGIAMVTVLRESLAGLDEDALGPACEGEAAWPYQGRRTVAVRGVGGELYEIVESGAP